MKIIIRGLLLFSFVFVATTVRSETPSHGEWSSMEKKLVSATRSLPSSCVRLHCEATGNMSSGVLVDPDGTILTVSHAFKSGESKVTVFFSNGEKSEALVVEHDEDRHVAILRLAGKTPDNIIPAVASAPHPISEEKVQPVFAVGFGGSESATVRLGFGSRDPRSGDWVTTCRLTAGDSGGGLFSPTGELLAIHTATTSNGKNRSLHIDLSRFTEGGTVTLADASHHVP